MLIIIPLHLAILISLQYTNCLTDYNIQHISKLKPRHTTWPNDIAESKLCHTTSWMRQKEGALATGLWWSPPLNLFTLKPISSTLLWAQHSMPIIQFLLFLSELWRYMNKRKAHCNHASTVHCTHRKQVRERKKSSGCDAENAGSSSVRGVSHRVPRLFLSNTLGKYFN